MAKMPLIVILGPTAVGKTSLSVRLAQKFGGEIVCVDSMQIYEHMRIGTALPTIEERRGVKHHLFGEVSPLAQFDVAEYVKLARECISGIYSEGSLPFLVGGTGLYIDILTKNLKLSQERPDLRYREELQEFAKQNGTDKLYDRLREVDSEYASKISSFDERRIIRALEAYKTTGRTMTELGELSRMEDTPYDALYLGVSLPRETLCERIYMRVDEMIKEGFAAEVENLVAMGVDENSTAMQAIGYKEMLSFLRGEITSERAAELIKISTRQYAKRQMTWWRRNGEIVWHENKEGIFEFFSEKISLRFPNH